MELEQKPEALRKFGMGGKMKKLADIIPALQFVQRCQRARRKEDTFDRFADDEISQRG